MVALSTSDDKVLRYPEEYDSTIPDVNLATFLIERMKLFGNDVAIIDPDTNNSYTYNQLIDRIRSLAAALQTKMSLKPNEMVAIALPTCLEYIIVVLAVNLCGGTNILINPSQTIHELQHAVKLSKPTLWFGSEDFFRTQYSELYKCTYEKPPFISLKKSTDNSTVDLMYLMHSGNNKEVTMKPNDQKDSIAFVLFSSGTTGVPKGVMITNANYVATRLQSLELTKFLPRNDEDSTVMFMPLYHAAGLNGLFECTARGLRFLLLANFTLDRLLKTIQSYKVTALFVVPSVAVQLTKLSVERNYDLSSLKMLRSGAAPIGKETIESLKSKYNCLYFQVYGLTEASLCTHGNTFTHNRDGSIGIVMPFCEAKVVNRETNRSLGPNEEGEICVRGPLVMKGYIGDETATRNTIDSDGWLHTGDVGYYDDEGYFFITDRMKELIKYKGFQVSPSELEHILLEHPDVVDAAIGRIPLGDVGEVPRGYVVRRSGSSITEEEIASFVAERVSPHKRLRGGVIFVSNIPKTSTGKILRRKLPMLQSKL